MGATMDNLLLLPGGLALGLAFYGGLWWTVRRGLSLANPAPLFAASLLLRLTLAVGGLWLLAAGDWRRLLLALLAFMLARPLIARLLPQAEEAADAT